MEKEQINPWVHLWTEPRKTLRSILSTDPRRVIIWLAIVSGIITSLNLAAQSITPVKGAIQLIFILIAAIIMGAVIGIACLYLLGWLIKLTGSWLGGKGTFTETKCAAGWSNYPFLVANIFALLATLSGHLTFLRLIFSLLNLVAFFWGVVIFVKLIGEAHQFSAWKGLLSLIITAVLVAVVIMIIALIIPLLTPLFR